MPGRGFCAGHILVELPLVLLVAAGVGAFLRPRGVQAGITLVGGLLLVVLGLQLLASLRKSATGGASFPRITIPSGSG